MLDGACPPSRILGDAQKGTVSTRLVSRIAVAVEGCCSHIVAMGATDACQLGGTCRREGGGGARRKLAKVAYLTIAVVLRRCWVAVVWLGRVAAEALGRTGARKPQRCCQLKDSRGNGSERAWHHTDSNPEEGMLPAGARHRKSVDSLGSQT